MADQTLKQNVSQIQDDLGTMKPDLAVAKNDIRQTKSDVREIKDGLRDIKEGYVPVQLYMRDQDAIYKAIAAGDEQAVAAQGAADKANGILSNSKPGLDFSNKIVQQIVVLFSGGIVAAVVLYLTTQNGATK